MNISLPIVTSPTIDSVDVGVAVLAAAVASVEELTEGVADVDHLDVAGDPCPPALR